MGEPDLVVIRAAADLPAGFLPPDLEGLWLDRSRLLVDTSHGNASPARIGGAVAIPTGRFETRGDGAVAEVFEVRP